jgi:hypothetical protein
MKNLLNHPIEAEAASLVIVGQIEPRPIDQLIPYANNARTHSEAQIEQIAQSIREFGFVNPILVGIDHIIIAGHARLLAARKLGSPCGPLRRRAAFYCHVKGQNRHPKVILQGGQRSPAISTISSE